MRISNPDNKFIDVSGEESFRKLTLETFRFQSENCSVYKQYLELIGCDASQVEEVDEIPYLPIEFFKSHKVYCGKIEEKLVFNSSGTTGMVPSKHFIARPELYEASFTSFFEMLYGNPEDYCFLALLPSYLERGNSSLVYMMNSLIRKSRHTASGFYLDDLKGLSKKLAELESNGTRAMLLGVGYALLELASTFPVKLNNTILVETGGMKGSRKELTKAELHKKLCDAFGLKEIHSEYGMTELLSQAWSKGDGKFLSPPWMKINIRDPYDPFSFFEHCRTGGVNVIDLANLYSCSFIESKDLGRLSNEGSFEIIGRFDHSDIRGCNLLVQ